MLFKKCLYQFNQLSTHLKFWPGRCQSYCPTNWCPIWFSTTSWWTMMTWTRRLRSTGNFCPIPGSHIARTRQVLAASLFGYGEMMPNITNCNQKWSLSRSVVCWTQEHAPKQQYGLCLLTKLSLGHFVLKNVVYLSNSQALTQWHISKFYR